jgi:hypothetical protein
VCCVALHLRVQVADARTRGTLGAVQTYTVHRRIPLASVKAHARDDLPGTPNALAILSLDKSVVVQAPSARERDVWVTKLNEAAAEFRHRRESIHTSSDALHAQPLLGSSSSLGRPLVGSDPSARLQPDVVGTRGQMHRRMASRG